ncbi:hypothetical protein [Streptomyces sp. NPDC002187]|uniref:hypothetical protein n=1 Tax=Streptomyces sp. NPDC002187 TaxID=3364637 RepID=UPI0036BBDED1
MTTVTYGKEIDVTITTGVAARARCRAGEQYDGTLTSKARGLRQERERQAM